MQNNLASRRRRRLIQAGGALAGAAALGFPSLVLAQNRTIKIGYVSPQTGPLAPFGEADKFVIEQMNERVQGRHRRSAARSTRSQIMLKDSQSNPNRAGEVANDLILKDKVDLMLVSLARPRPPTRCRDACELNELPCISTVVPWQPWFFGRKGDPAKGFNWTYHFFWGLEDVIANFTNGWKIACRPTRRSAACSPTTATATPGATRSSAFPKPLAKAWASRCSTRAASRTCTHDFSAQIAAFKKDNVEIVTGVVIPPDAKTFLHAGAGSRASSPRSSRSARRCCSPARSRRWAISATACRTEVWWSPSHPFTSSLTKQSAKAARRRLRGRAPRSSGRSRSASRTRCSRWRPTRSSAARVVTARPTCATRWRRPT